jgi:hypothetical protein
MFFPFLTFTFSFFTLCRQIIGRYMKSGHKHYLPNYHQSSYNLKLYASALTTYSFITETIQTLLLALHIQEYKYTGMQT